MLGTRHERLDGAHGFGILGFLGIVAAWSLSTATAYAQGLPLPLTGELPVNQAVAGAQQEAEVAMAPNGTHFVVWQGHVAGGTTDIFLRRFPGDGTAPFNESTLNQGTTGSQLAPAIDMNGSGNWIALWTADQSGQGVRARTASSGGTVLGSEFQFSDSTTGTGFSAPSASRAADGSSRGAWVDFGPKFRSFDASGAANFGGLAAGASLVAPASPSVLAAADGELWIVLEGGDADGAGIYLERYDPFGTQIGPSVLVAESEDNSQIAAEIAGAADGGFVVTWRDLLLGVRARCFAADGASKSPEVAVDAADQGARIGVAPDGAFVVTWKTEDNDIAVREFDRTCRPVGPAFTVNTATAGFQSSPDAASSNDRYVVVWHGADVGGDGESFGVGRRLFKRRSLYSDGFESNDFASWSAAVP